MKNQANAGGNQARAAISKSEVGQNAAAGSSDHASASEGASQRVAKAAAFPWLGLLPDHVVAAVNASQASNRQLVRNRQRSCFYHMNAGCKLVWIASLVPGHLLMRAKQGISNRKAMGPDPLQLRMVHWWDKELQCEEDMEGRQYLRALMAAKKVKLCWGVECSPGRERVLLNQG